MWKTHKIKIRGSQPSKLRLCTPYYLLKADIDRFLEKFDDYKRKITPLERWKDLCGHVRVGLFKLATRFLSCEAEPVKISALLRHAIEFRRSELYVSAAPHS
jgi:hypothetical protein